MSLRRWNWYLSGFPFNSPVSLFARRGPRSMIAGGYATVKKRLAKGGEVVRADRLFQGKPPESGNGYRV